MNLEWVERCRQQGAADVSSAGRFSGSFAGQDAGSTLTVHGKPSSAPAHALGP